jgi:UPF0271 protein
MARTFVDLNADVGEGCGQDAAIMPLISSANIACGYHAGDAQSMREAISLARDLDVAIGAHPSFPDRKNFGRVEMRLSVQEVRDAVVAQIESLAEIAVAQRTHLRHVKPHGALYNMAARDEQLAEAIVSAVSSVDRNLALFGLSGSALISIGTRMGIRTLSEVFADRGYRPDGTLLPRSEPGSVLHDGAQVAARAVTMLTDQSVIAADGTRVALRADTICVHGDTPGAALLAAHIRGALAVAGITVAAPLLRP